MISRQSTWNKTLNLRFEAAFSNFSLKDKRKDKEKGKKDKIRGKFNATWDFCVSCKSQVGVWMFTC